MKNTDIVVAMKRPRTIRRLVVMPYPYSEVGSCFRGAGQLLFLVKLGDSVEPRTEFAGALRFSNIFQPEAFGTED